MDLKSLGLPPTLDTSDAEIIRDFFVPALSASVRYDRAVGFFSAGWLQVAAEGMAAFAGNGGRARWVTSPFLSKEDWEALQVGQAARHDEVLTRAIERGLDELERALEQETLSALAWLVADGILDFKLALPRSKLEHGEYHDKFGVFTDVSGNQVSFNGAYNDSIQGLRCYDSFKIFCSWQPASTLWVQADVERFERLWNNEDPNVRVFDLPASVREQIIGLRTGARPFARLAERERLSDSLNLPYPLRPYQWTGVRFLTRSQAALLADEMGLGKTVQVAVALEVLFRRGKLNRALVVTPASLKLNWCQELRKWTSGPSVQQVRGDAEDRQAYYRLPINILVASYEEVRGDVMGFVNAVGFDIVVLDEAQRIKNPNSQTALACKLLGRQRSWALTGTPLENKLDDLISIFRFIKGGLLHDALTREEVHSRMRPHFLRRCKREVMRELPPIIDQEIPLVLEGAQRRAYHEAWEHRFSTLADGSYASMLAMVTRLKQLCNYDPESGQSAKLKVLESIFDDLVAEEDKVIVFSQYVETLNWLSSRIERIPYGLFHGGLSQDERASVLDKFRGDPGPRALLMSLRAGGVGLNIQEASVVVLFDRWWNPALENQAVQRAHRFARTRPLHAIRFLVVDSIEERISGILEKKQDLFERYIEAAASADTACFDQETLRLILDIPCSHEGRNESLGGQNGQDHRV